MNQKPDVEESASVRLYRTHVQQLLDRAVSESGVPGAVIEVRTGSSRVGACSGQRFASQSISMSPSTLFELGVGATHVLSSILTDLESNGLLSLEAPISRIIHEIDGHLFGRLSLLHLLQHTGGFTTVNLADPNIRNDFDWPQLVQQIRLSEQVFEPGSAFSYDPRLLPLAGEVIRRVTGKSAATISDETQGIETRDGASAHFAGSHQFDATLRTFVQMPAFSFGAFWDVGLANRKLSASGFLNLIEKIRLAQKSQAVRPSEASQLTLPRMSGGAFSESLPLRISAGGAEFVRDWFGFNGPVAGQSVHVRYHRSHHASIVVAINAHVPLLCDKLLLQLIESLGGNTHHDEPAIDMDAPSAEELVGAYRGINGGKLSVSREGLAIIVELVHPRAPRFAIRLEMDSCRHWIVRTDPGPWAVGVFRNGFDGRPCLQIGAVAYGQV
jgi:hypothetical protein